MKPRFGPAIVLAAFLCAVISGDFVRCQEPDARTNTLTVNSREALQLAVGNAKPGTMIRIAPGTYRGGLSFSQVRGAKGKPIVLTALDPKQPPVFQGGGSGLHFRQPQYLNLHHLVIAGVKGNGLNIDDGGSLTDPAKHVVLRDLQIRDVGPNGNRDAIKLSGVDHFVVEDCTIERWGDNGSAIDMVGCHHGEINDCVFRYQSDLAANGVQTKGGSSDVAIRRSRFENAGNRAVNIGGSTGQNFFRPQDANYEAKDITVEDCTFIGSMSPIAFVGVDGALVRHCTIYRPTRWIVRILQETTDADFVPCRNGRFSNCIIAYRSDEVRLPINIGGGTLPKTFQFSKNVWYCIDNPGQSRRLSLPTEETEGRYGIDPLFRNEKEHDLRLSKKSPIRDAGVREAANDSKS